jgi:transposase-like protein
MTESSNPRSSNRAHITGRLDEFRTLWDQKYPAIESMRAYGWPEFVPFLDYSPEIRRLIYSTSAIESLNARFRRATRALGHFPNEQAALKCLYLFFRSLGPKRSGQERWMKRWKPTLNAFAITSRAASSEALPSPTPTTSQASHTTRLAVSLLGLKW